MTSTTSGPGGGQYTLLCNERGGVIDDLYAYQLSQEVYFLIVNASRTEADVAWLQARAAEFPGREDLRLTDASHQYAAVAVQGPRVVEFIDACIPGTACSGTRVDRVTALKKTRSRASPADTPMCRYHGPVTRAKTASRSSAATIRSGNCGM